MDRIKIAHIVNPVNISSKSDLYVAQPITFESMRRAQQFGSDEVDVELFSAQYPEDHEIVPKYFSKTPDLQRSVLDLRSFEKPRKLPILSDILDRLNEASDADYFIYTNVDIAVLPNFYLSVKSIIDQGYDAFVINRRTIDDKYRHIDELNLMYQEIGDKHVGHDCFVFKREVLSQFYLAEICIGVSWIGRILLWNLIAHSKKFKEMTNSHLTFHIGDARSSYYERFNDYFDFNIGQSEKVHAKIRETIGDSFKYRQDIPPYLYYEMTNNFRKTPLLIKGYKRLITPKWQKRKERFRKKLAALILG